MKDISNDNQAEIIKAFNSTSRSLINVGLKSLLHQGLSDQEYLW